MGWLVVDLLAATFLATFSLTPYTAGQTRRVCAEARMRLSHPQRTNCHVSY